jgi:HD domain-containing protein/transketolase-like protein
VRVAGYVDELARALGLPFRDIDRLRWAARLHDLGKVAVDSAVLRKRGRLTAHEWGAMRRAPRLSARILRRFELSAAEARAVEYHHERYDGAGYYGLPAAELPLASHFLIVADSFDAMRSDRPYRPGLSVEDALAEIEANIGSQFHPAVAKAFIAVQRGQDPYSALTAEEQEELRSAAAPHHAPHLPGAGDLRERPELLALCGLVAALAGVGIDQPLLAVGGVVLAATGIVVRAWARYRSGRVRRGLAAVLSAGERTQVFSRLAETLHATGGADWIGLVDWEEDGLGGSLELSRGEAPPERALMGWLVREAESREELLSTSAHELGGPAGAYVALPVRRENSALAGFVVMRAPRVLPRHVRSALVKSLDSLGVALAETPRAEAPQPPGGLLRAGRDLSLVAAPGLGAVAESAALLLGEEGLSVEVVELNGNREWNEQTVIESVRKTSKVVLLHSDDDEPEASALAALIADRAFEDLDGPVRRVRSDGNLPEALRDLAGF